jgi:hypothetical protein
VDLQEVYFLLLLNHLVLLHHLNHPLLLDYYLLFHHLHHQLMLCLKILNFPLRFLEVD